MSHEIDRHGDMRGDLRAEADAGIRWVSEALRWTHVMVPVLLATLGVVCIGYADALALHGTPASAPLWWVGVLLIFVPALTTLLFVTISRSEAVVVLLVTGLALYAVKLLYAPGRLWGFDELLHFRTVDNLIAAGHLFSYNALLPVSPYYPGMETVTAVIVRLTGLSIVQSGLVLIGVARLLTVIALFLLLERIATPSKLAAPATLLYMTSPAFLYFDSMFSYESLAIALALACLFALRTAQLEEGRRRDRLNAVGALLLLAVVVTHHVTSFILVATLVAWTVVDLAHGRLRRKKARECGRLDARARKRRVYLGDLPGSGWVPVLGVVAVLVWLTNVAEITVAYLWPQLMSGFIEVARIISFEGTGRQLFQSTAGHTAPPAERIVGIGSVLIILALIPFGIRYLWERRHTSVLSRFLAVAALVYPASLALRFTKSGWDIGSRATAFIYVPLAFTVAAGIESLISRDVKYVRLRVLTVVLALSLVFAGGIIAGTSPITRQPAPYDPGVAEVPYDTESLAAAGWTANTLGPGNRFAGDSAGGTLIGSIGRQQLVTSDATVSVSTLFLSPGFNTPEQTIVRNGRIAYVLVDRRIAGSEPLKGFIYERWERQAWDYGSTVSSETVNKFDVLRDASKVYDSGNIQIFGLQRLVP